MLHTRYEIRFTIHKPLRGFTLVEILIVVTILGILAAIVLPEYRGYAQQAKESAAKENLQILRSAIERYAIQHNGVSPGYLNGDTTINPNLGLFLWQLTLATDAKGQVAVPETPDFPYGPYISQIPENPFNGSCPIKVLPNNMPIPPEATGQYGWICKPATKAIRIDWPGTDSKGVRYYDY